MKKPDPRHQSMRSIGRFMPEKFSPEQITQSLIQCPSITPEDAGALDTLQGMLEELGFTCHRYVINEDNSDDIDNLYAKLGSGSPHFCFAGHTDVVPTGNKEEWTRPPFEASLENGSIIGRGAVDMKGGIACFVAAVKSFLDKSGSFQGSISFLITGDEEGRAVNGTDALLRRVDQELGEKFDFCLVGEPSNPTYLGEMIKVGRRGSLTTNLTIKGVQGHVAYPHNADNPCHKAVTFLNYLKNLKLDDGNEYFQPSCLQITSIDVGNPTSNVIPAEAKMQFNIRYNDMHNSISLRELLASELQLIARQEECEIEYKFHSSGESFRTDVGEFVNQIQGIINKHTGHTPELSTSGGTSDGRFIYKYCPVIEFGLIGQTMHKIDEQVALTDLHKLTEIYEDILNQFFA